MTRTRLALMLIVPLVLASCSTSNTGQHAAAPESFAGGSGSLAVGDAVGEAAFRSDRVGSDRLVSVSIVID